MADDQISVAPAAQPAAVVPFKLMLAGAPDTTGQYVETQAVCLVDEFGRPIVPMTESTGQDLVQAIKALHALMANQLGGLMPSTRGLNPPSDS